MIFSGDGNFEIYGKKRRWWNSGGCDYERVKRCEEEMSGSFIIFVLKYLLVYIDLVKW